MIAIYLEKKSGRKDFVKSILNGSLRFSALDRKSTRLNSSHT